MKIRELIADYLKHMKALGRSYYTIKVAKYEIRALADFMEKEQLYNVEDMTGDVLREYQEELAFRLTAKGRLLSPGTQSKIMAFVFKHVLTRGMVANIFGNMGIENISKDIL